MNLWFWVESAVRRCWLNQTLGVDEETREVHLPIEAMMLLGRPRSVKEAWKKVCRDRQCHEDCCSLVCGFELLLLEL